jgi:type IV fimbrial biogenesis protein FimT
MCIAIKPVMFPLQASTRRVADRCALARGHSVCGCGNGFTMVELLVTIAIVAILIALAAPVISSPKSGSESNLLLGTLQFARSKAVQQGLNVIVCPSANPNAATPTCTTANWATGWIVLVPTSTTSAALGCAATGAAGDLILQSQQALTSHDTAVFSALGTGTNTDFCFTRYGFSYAAYTGYVQFDSSPVNLKNRRCVAVSGVGHVQVLNAGQTDVNGVTCP